jgi:phosphatidylglycerophosphate synthase/alkylated DNA repair dioxygenase AlkB
MAESVPVVSAASTSPRPWDARLARWLVMPLKNSRVTPNHLTTLRLAVGMGAAAAFTPGTYGWANLAALLLVLSNFLDHTDGELARISGKGSRLGHYYDLASDALITVCLFIAIGVGVNATGGEAAATVQFPLKISPTILGGAAGVAIAIIFLLRLQIENLAGKAGTQQAAFAGFETEDVLYLLPLITLCNGLTSFLTLASIGAPLFAIWVAIDYRRTMSRQRPQQKSVAAPSKPERAPVINTLDPLVAATTARFDLPQLRQHFLDQGAFLVVPQFADSAMVQQLIAAVDNSKGSINRNYIPGHKQGGSVSRHVLDRAAPFVAQLYRSPVLIDWLSSLAGEPLQCSPPDDPHAYALYFYTNPGDHIGWHYDTSYYAGRRYTVLLGVIEESSCRLEYQLHTREAGVAETQGSIRMEPGDLVFFDGDKLRHRITPLSQTQRRVSLTLEYVTDPRMHPGWRLISKMKDAVAYFGFRQVFRRISARTER